MPTIAQGRKDMNEEMMLEDGLFDDFAEEDFAEETNETEESLTDEGTPTSNDTPIENDSNSDEPFMTIKYNSEEKGLSKEEAITMAQKGMNYDKINTNYNNMKTEFDAMKPIYDQFSKLAEESGMDVGSYIESLQNMQKNYAISKEVEALKAQYPTTDTALLEEIARKRVEDNARANAQLAQQNANNEQEARKNEIKRQLEVFEKRYPKVNPQELDQRVYDLMDDGLTLLEAYQEVESEKRSVEAQKQQEKDNVDKHNQSNARKGLGNIGNAENIDVDDFLSGLNS